jgi:hypothetical protein
MPHSTFTLKRSIKLQKLLVLYPWTNPSFRKGVRAQVPYWCLLCIIDVMFRICWSGRVPFRFWTAHRDSQKGSASNLHYSFSRFTSVRICYTGRFIMFFVITSTYNNITKAPTLMELFTAIGKLKRFFFGLEVFDVCTTGDTAQWSVPLGTDHCSSEEYRCTHVDACVARIWISYWYVPYHPWCTHRTSLVVKKTFSVFIRLWKIPLRWVLWFYCYKYL